MNCNWGCKPLPKSCKQPCDCNGAWSINANGTITSVMDGKCLQISDTSMATVTSCTGKPNQKFAFKQGSGAAGPAHYTVSQGALCITGAPPPAPPPTPCPNLANATACDAAVDKHGKPRCSWNATAGKCSLPPPPPPPQPCEEITVQADCRWSNSPSLPKGRDCRWVGGKCGPAPPLPPLPACAADHSCAHNGLSEAPPMGWVITRNLPNAKMLVIAGSYLDRCACDGNCSARGTCLLSATTTQRCGR